jgi:Concanavalin A-like lectin/glucanases superfamily
MNSESSNSASFLMKPTFGSQFVLALVILITLFVFLLAVEQVYKSYLQMGLSKLALYPYTVGSQKTIVIDQDPSNARSKTVYPSENEVTGIEFSYSLFVYIQESTFNSNATGTTSNQLKAVFHKGYRNPFPLCSPGVFVHTAKNSLRIIMNSYANWFNYVDINDIPVEKWFHLVLVCRSSSLEVYVNGNLAQKISMNGSVPYQNYQPIVLFTNETKTITSQNQGLPANVDFNLMGPMNGYLSNLFYFRYALSFSEIQNMMNLGPSREFASEDMDRPPYLIDSWWTQPTA